MKYILLNISSLTRITRVRELKFEPCVPCIRKVHAQSHSGRCKQPIFGSDRMVVIKKDTAVFTRNHEIS